MGMNLGSKSPNGLLFEGHLALDYEKNGSKFIVDVVSGLKTMSKRNP